MLRRPLLHNRHIFVTVAYLGVILAIPQGTFAWGREGHEIIVVVAERYMRPESTARIRELLAPESPQEASVWADEYRRDHRNTGPWHYIDIPLADSKINMAREYSNGDCVIAKTEQFLAVLRDPNADKDAKAQALKFVIHFVGDLHQPLHVADNGDKGGNTRYVIFDGRHDNLHWVWDTGLIQHINRNPAAFAAELERRITLQDKGEWRVVALNFSSACADPSLLSGQALKVGVTQTVAYGDLSNENPAPITAAYEPKTLILKNRRS